MPLNFQIKRYGIHVHILRKQKNLFAGDLLSKVMVKQGV